MPTDTIWIPPPSPKDQKRRKHQRQRLIKWLGLSEKTLWDWLQLLAALAVPVAIAIGTTWFSAEQSQASEQASEKQHQTDIQIANDQQQETALQTYLDRMSDLLLNNKLRESQPGDEVRNVARARTITVLTQLNGTRKGEIIRFLDEVGLINQRIEIISLRDADLRKANLHRAYLTYASLIGADLSGADLSDVDLTYASLSGANLISANLRDANLISADLSGANLISTNLSSAYLISADLRGANFISADLNGADLGSAHLYGADLRGANLISANLRDADLRDADLRGADLRGAYNMDLKETQLQEAIYNREAMQDKDEQGNPITRQPTQWPHPNFNPKDHGAICLDCETP